MIKYVLAILFLLIESIYCTSFAKLPVVWSVYGAKILSDDDESMELLHKLAIKSGNEDIDFLNSLALIDVAQVSDGILSELLGSICIEDITNKTKTIISIFDKFGSDKLDPYLNRISEELYLSNESCSSSTTDIFNNFVICLKTNGLSRHENYILQNIIESIKAKVNILEVSE